MLINVKRPVCNYLIILLIIFFGFLYSLTSITKHNHYQTGLDLAIYVQSMWYYTHFEVPRVTFKPNNGDIAYTDHFDPSLALLTPLFLIWKDPKFLLIIQSLLFTIGAYPIYLFAKERLKHTYLALSLSLSYLIFYSSQYTLTFDLHMATLSASFFPWIFYFMFKENWKTFLTLSVLAAGFKEDTPLYLVALGIYLIISGKNRKVGFFLASLMSTYFFLVTHYLMPMLRQNFETPTKAPLLTLSYLNLFYVFFSSWIKVKTLLISLGSFLFLPIFSGWFILLPLTHFFINFVIPGLEGRWDIYLHYHVHLASILVFATIISYQRLIKNFSIFNFDRAKSLTALGLLIGVLIFDYSLHLPLNSLAKKNFYQKEAWMDDLESAIKKVPPEAGVMTMQHLLPHLAFRKDIRFYRYIPSDNKNIQTLSKTDYILLDMRSNQSINNYWYSENNHEKLQKSLNELIKNHLFYKYFQEGNALVLKRAS